jgi:hypothetical protein
MRSKREGAKTPECNDIGLATKSVASQGVSRTTPVLSGGRPSSPRIPPINRSPVPPVRFPLGFAKPLI